MISSAEFSEPKSKQERQERRARLEREAEVVKAQLQELKNRLPQLYKAGPNGAPSKQGGVSKKRPAPVGGELAGENKRQRVELERARRVNGIWQQCQTILKGLSKSVLFFSAHNLLILPSQDLPYSHDSTCYLFSTETCLMHSKSQCIAADFK